MYRPTISLTNSHRDQCSPLKSVTVKKISGKNVACKHAFVFDRSEDVLSFLKQNASFHGEGVTGAEVERRRCENRGHMGTGMGPPLGRRVKLVKTLTNNSGFFLLNVHDNMSDFKTLDKFDMFYNSLISSWAIVCSGTLVLNQEGLTSHFNYENVVNVVRILWVNVRYSFSVED